MVKAALPASGEFNARKILFYATNRNRRSMNGKLKRMVFKLGINHHAFAERGSITPVHEIFGSRVFMQ
jgi:hypothetical protein